MNYKSLIPCCLIYFPMITCAANWHMIEGPNLNGFANKNTDYKFIDNYPKTQTGEGTILSVGKTLSSCSRFDVTEPGFYDIIATVSSSSSQGVCYVFGKGEGATMSSTMIPIGEKLKVTVRGVATNGNHLIAGVFSDGNHQVQLHGIEIKRSHEYNFLQGGDITELNYVLDYGGKYSADDGSTLTPEGLSREEQAQNVINYLAANGMNFARIRLTNNPGQPDQSKTYYLPEGYQDESDCLQLAKMAKDAGMEIQFTFNWSDFWSNGTRQDVPIDWLQAIKNANGRRESDILAECAYNYTKKVMQNLAALDIYPAYVSLGNETNGGFLFPYAYAYDVKSGEATMDMPQGNKNWTAISQIVNAGYDAVKEVSPNSLVVIHLADNTYDVVDKHEHVDWWVYSWYFDELIKYGTKFDIIGASYYPSWSTATAAEAAQFYRQLIKRYNRDVLVMETGYNWAPKRKDGADGQLPYTAPAYKNLYNFSKDGQKGFMADVINEFKGVYESNGHRVIGDLYWDPLMIHVEDQYGKNATGWAHWYKWGTPDANVVENTTLFDFDGKALPVFDTYRNNRNSHFLQQHKVMAEMAEGNGFISTNKQIAYFGDSITIELKYEDDYAIDSIQSTSKFDINVIKAFPDSASIKLEMPDSDLSIKVFCSKRNKTFVNNTISDCLDVTTDKGMVCIHSVKKYNVSILDISGKTIHTLDLQPNQKEMVSLPSGVYLIGNKKITIR